MSSSARAKVLLLEPYGSASHEAWALGHAAASSHDVRTVVLPAERWRWRLRAGAVGLADAAAEAMADGWRPDAIVVSGMVDVAAFLGLTRSWSSGLPVLLYLHETQFAYPDPDVTGAFRPAEQEFAATNAVSMAAADLVVFNSSYHRIVAAAGVQWLYNDKGEPVPVDLSDARIVPVGVETSAFVGAARSVVPDEPLILWNHRWDHDKNPQAFFRALRAIDDLPWRLAVVGENTRSDPQEFDAAAARWADRVVAWGHQPRDRYVDLLRRADVVVSTAHHEYFGVAMVEAMAAGAVPLLPNRCSYPELVGGAHGVSVLYEDGELVDRLRSVLGDLATARAAVDGLADRMVERFDQQVAARLLDDCVAGLISADDGRRP